MCVRWCRQCSEHGKVLSFARLERVQPFFFGGVFGRTTRLVELVNGVESFDGAWTSSGRRAVGLTTRSLPPSYGGLPGTCVKLE